MHTIAILAFDGVVPSDLALPCDLFARVRLRDGRAPYDVRVCAATKDVRTGAFDLRARWGLRAVNTADTIFVPGVADPRHATPPAILRTLQRAARRGARVASICSGAFILAEAGLLDGLRATTHWLGAPELARRYPKIAVDPNVLFVDNGRILTSAGAAAGLDLCLHMVRCDHGSAVAADAARMAVMPLERTGGQAQFIAHEPPTPDAHGASLEPVLRWLERNDDASLTLEDISRRARMSVRTLCRRFREQTGTTPLQYLLRARVRRGQCLLETTDESIERIAYDVGFGSPTTFRTAFQRIVSTSPKAYRNAFRALTPPGR
ncbi:helix-turn-helix domain-containing protein [Pendulispora rubella]|uniref:Helix-turn-helix domain-containing protein n=1 Tax=Pendulispora rubella TaxID=2741070 RepID=A0ABZ2L5K2_9BACT